MNWIYRILEIAIDTNSVFQLGKSSIPTDTTQDQQKITTIVSNLVFTDSELRAVTSRY